MCPVQSQNFMAPHCQVRCFISTKYFVDFASQIYIGPGVDPAANRNEHQRYLMGGKRPVRWVDNPTAFMWPFSRDSGSLTNCSPNGLSRPTARQLYPIPSHMIRCFYGTATLYSGKLVQILSRTILSPSSGIQVLALIPAILFPSLYKFFRPNKKVICLSRYKSKTLIKADQTACPERYSNTAIT